MMERRSSNVENSAIRAARRRSAVTIIAPGEEPNPFQSEPNRPAPVKSAPPPATVARCDSYQPNVPNEETVNRAATTATPQPRPATRSQQQLPPQLSLAATSTPAPVNRPTPFIQPPSSNVDVPSSASNRMRGLHMFPNTPPTVAVAPAQRPVAGRGGNVVVVNGGGNGGAVTSRGVQFPVQPGARGGVAAGRPTAGLPLGMRQGIATPANLQGNRTGATPRTSPDQTPSVNRQGQPSPALPRGETPRGSEGDNALTSSHSSGPYPPPAMPPRGNGAPFFQHPATARRTSAPFSPQPQQQQQHPPSPSSAKWVASARRQPLNASAPNVTAGVMDNSKGARRATVPQAQGGRSPQRVELVRVPHPPSRRNSLQESEDEHDSNRSSAPEAPSLLLSMAPSKLGSGQSSTTSRNSSFARLSDNGRDTSVVIEDHLLDEMKEKAVTSSTSNNTSGSSEQHLSSSTRRRAESPPADNGDFLKPLGWSAAREPEMAPLSPQVKRPGPSHAAADNGSSSDEEEERSSSGDDEDQTDEDAEEGEEHGDDSGDADTSSSDEGEEEEEEDGTGAIHNPLGRPSRVSVHARSDSDASAILQSTLYFSPFDDRRKPTAQSAGTKKRAARAKPSPASVTAAQEPSESSLADFGLTSNDTLEPASFPTNSSSSANTVAKRCVSHTAVGLPSPVDLNTVLFRSAKKDPMMSSPLLDTSRRHRTNTAQSTRDGGAPSFARSIGGGGDGERRETSRDNSKESAGRNFEMSSVENWSFDYLAKNGLNNDTQGSEAAALSPRRARYAGGSPAAAATATSASVWSPTVSPRVAKAAAEEKWRVTQSLSINPSEFSFDHLPIGQQSSNVAKLRKVFESQRKSRREEPSSAVTSGSARAPPPKHVESPKQLKVQAVRSAQDAVATSVGSTVMAPRSEPSSKSSVHDTEEGEGEAGRSAVVGSSSAYAPSLDFSFDRLTPPVTAAEVKKMATVFPPIASSAQSNPVVREKPAPRTDTSESAFRFSWAASTEGGGVGGDEGSPLNRHSAPSGSASVRTASGRLPSISAAASEGGFSLARFHTSTNSVDSVNMFDRYDF